jgi:hypothetical protein
LPAEPYSLAEWRLRESALITTSKSRPTSIASRTVGTPSVDEARRHLAVELVHTTVHQHTSSSHRRYVDWTIERIRREAASIGPAVAEIVAASGRQLC